PPSPLALASPVHPGGDDAAPERLPEEPIGVAPVPEWPLQAPVGVTVAPEWSTREPASVAAALAWEPVDAEEVPEEIPRRLPPLDAKEFIQAGLVDEDG